MIEVERHGEGCVVEWEKLEVADMLQWVFWCKVWEALGKDG